MSHFSPCVSRHLLKYPVLRAHTHPVLSIATILELYNKFSNGINFVPSPGIKKL